VNSTARELQILQEQDLERNVVLADERSYLSAVQSEIQEAQALLSAVRRAEVIQKHEAILQQEIARFDEVIGAKRTECREVSQELRTGGPEEKAADRFHEA